MWLEVERRTGLSCCTLVFECFGRKLHVSFDAPTTVFGISWAIIGSGTDSDLLREARLYAPQCGPAYTPSSRGSPARFQFFLPVSSQVHVCG